MTKRSLLVLFLFFFPLDLEASDNFFLVGKGRVGKVELGSSMDSIYGIFEKVGPLTLLDKYLEASFTPIIKVHDKEKKLLLGANIVVENGKFSLQVILSFRNIGQTLRRPCRLAPRPGVNP